MPTRSAQPPAKKAASHAPVTPASAATGHRVPLGDMHVLIHTASRWFMPITMPDLGATAAASARSGRDSPHSKTIVSPGDVVGGRYVVEEVLGSGGMGVVVAARHATLGHRVAMKFVSASAAADAEAHARFSREARIIASLESEHVVRVTDFGVHAGSPYMVMDLLAGRDLGCELRQRGPLPLAEAVDYVIQACDGLWSTHAKGIVHRDVKLANLFLATRADGERVIKVLDFGVSKSQPDAQDDASLTRTATMIGSPLYMAPEQIRDPRRVDERADVWSLGIVLYKLLTDQAPFSGQSTNAVCAAIAADPPAPLRSHAADLPRELEAVVFRCLEKRPEHRYPTAAALARDLAPFASEAGAAMARQLVARAADEDPRAMGAPDGPLLEPGAAPGIHRLRAAREREPVARSAPSPHRGVGRSRGAHARRIGRRLAVEVEECPGRRVDGATGERGHRHRCRARGRGSATAPTPSEPGAAARGAHHRIGHGSGHARGVLPERGDRGAPPRGPRTASRVVSSITTARPPLRLMSRRRPRLALRRHPASADPRSMITSKRRAQRLAFVAGALILGASGRAGADDSAQGAEALFQRARERMGQGDFASACPMLEHAYALDHGAGTLLALAICHEGDRKPALALREFRESLNVSGPGESARSRDARGGAHVQSLEGSVPRIKLRPPTPEPVGLEVHARRRERSISAAMVAGVPVDPGPHVIEASAPPAAPWRTQVDVGRTPTPVVVDIPAFGTVAASTPSLRAPAPPSSAPRAFGWIVGGLGVAAAAVGAGFGVAAFDAEASSRRACQDNVCTPAGVDKNREARRDALVSDMTFAAAGVAVGAAVFLLLRGTSPSAAASTTPGFPGAARRFDLRVGYSIDGAEVGVTGSW